MEFWFGQIIPLLLSKHLWNRRAKLFIQHSHNFFWNGSPQTLLFNLSSFHIYNVASEKTLSVLNNRCFSCTSSTTSLVFSFFYRCAFSFLCPSSYIYNHPFVEPSMKTWQRYLYDPFLLRPLWVAFCFISPQPFPKPSNKKRNRRTKLSVQTLPTTFYETVV